MTNVSMRVWGKEDSPGRFPGGGDFEAGLFGVFGKTNLGG